jgi:cell division protein ZapA
MNDYLDISLLGREYRIACPPEEKELLMAAVKYLDERMDELSSKTQSGGEKLAVMTALNIAHDFLLYQRGHGIDMPAIKRRIGLMSARIDGVLNQKEKPFGKAP